jgi:hypothetical protein
MRIGGDILGQFLKEEGMALEIVDDLFVLFISEWFFRLVVVRNVENVHS